MDEERAKRLVAALRARRVMAHVVEAGVYEFGVRVVVDGAIEALWDVDGAAGLDAELVEDGVLIGFVPHVPGSEEFTEEQLVDAIATTRYSAEGLRPPTDSGPPPDRTESPPAPPVPPSGAPPVARYRRRAHWPRRGGP
ncbi:hypothetical protein [Streptomyces qinzhouensis]|uniref:Uncharacterized protein n=1 Tax=Streptomyces qinzhouensis TaxID=2599401 RepID=A0A5B8J698_9ACTN|nr:hypothetical protein [Streptomyces qinzhouensis]QDY75551.1 hypothetical protein FQU76_02410 [Streptomyces qinzhouensis]